MLKSGFKRKYTTLTSLGGMALPSQAQCDRCTHVRTECSVAAGVQPAACLHLGSAAGLHAVRAGRGLVVGDALVHAVVAGAAHQLGHAGRAVSRVALLLHAVLASCCCSPKARQAHDSYR